MEISKIGVVLPTYNDGDQWYQMLSRFTESLVHIREVDNLEFLVNYQNVDTKSYDDIMMSTLEDFIYSMNPTWGLIYRVSDPYPKPISMVKIRNDCMMLDPDCDLYLFVDDDMKFNSGAGDCYNEIIKFFEDNDDLGLVMSAGFLGGYNYKNQLKYTVKKHWTVCRGLFIRNLRTCADSPIYPVSALSIHEGGYEEMIAAMEVIRKGYKMATHFNNPTTHKVMPMDVGKEANKDCRYEDDQIHNIDRSFTSSSTYLAQEYGINLKIKKAKDYQNALELINLSRERGK